MQTHYSPDTPTDEIDGAHASGTPSLGEDIRTLFRAFWSRRLLIVAIMAGFGLLGLGYMWLATPGYRATAEILIDPHTRQMVEIDGMPTASRAPTNNAETALLESQVEVLRSRSVMGTLIERYGLETDPLFGAGGSGGIAGLVKAVFYGPNYASYEHTAPFDRAHTRLMSATRVERVGNTYVLRITVTTPDPVRSAELANGIAQIYLEEQQQARDAAAGEAAGAIEARLANLRESADAAQLAVERYRADNSLFATGGVMVDEQQLGNLSEQVTAASNATTNARAQLGEVERDRALALSGNIDGASLSSPAADELRAALSAAVSEENSLRSVYGPRHPQLIRASESRQAFERALIAELDRIVGRTRSDYERAAQVETDLRAQLAALQTRQVTSNTAQIELRQLQQQADTSRDLFDAFAQRARQAREQIDLPGTTARFISPARASSQPAEPRLVTVMAMSLMAGTMVSFGAAWVLHILFGTPIGAPRRQPRPAAPAVVAAPPAPLPVPAPAPRTRVGLSERLRRVLPTPTPGPEEAHIEPTEAAVTEAPIAEIPAAPATPAPAKIADAAPIVSTSSPQTPPTPPATQRPALSPSARAKAAAAQIRAAGPAPAHARTPEAASRFGNPYVRRLATPKSPTAQPAVEETPGRAAPLRQPLSSRRPLEGLFR